MFLTFYTVYGFFAAEPVIKGIAVIVIESGYIIDASILRIVIYVLRFLPFSVIVRTSPLLKVGLHAQSGSVRSASVGDAISLIGLYVMVMPELAA